MIAEQGLAELSELRSAVDDRTLDILERRRRSGIVRRRGWLVRRALLGADLAGLVAAFAISEALAGDPPGAARLDLLAESLVFVLSLPIWVVVAKIYGLYDRDEKNTDHSTVDDFTGVFHLVTVGTWIVYSGSHALNVANPALTRTMLFWTSAIATISLARAVARALCRYHASYFQNAVVVGAGDVGQMIGRKLLKHPEYGVNLVGFVDAAPRERDAELARVPVLGALDRLMTIVRAFDIDRVIIAFSNEPDGATLELIEALKDDGVQVDIVSRFFETVGFRASIHTVEGIALLGVPPQRLSPSSLILKRGLDLGLASILLVLAAPVMALVTVAVFLDSGPVLFRDQRVGRGGELFRAYKFRTMRPDSEQLLSALLEDPVVRQEYDRTHKLRDDPRVTRLGAFLRRTSLDELPQLVNVLRGDVSLVGPRPITRFEFDRYSAGAGKAGPYWESNLRPGLTGYWQISGRSGMTYADRVRLDAAYVHGWSLGLDLIILAKTLRVLLARAGAY
jgi:exopolysaccharide biosynthesis polyprenyl glycosylphosphotransferase